MSYIAVAQNEGSALVGSTHPGQLHLKTLFPEGLPLPAALLNSLLAETVLFLKP